MEINTLKEAMLIEERTHKLCKEFEAAIAEVRLRALSRRNHYKRAIKAYERGDMKTLVSEIKEMPLPKTLKI